MQILLVHPHPATRAELVAKLTEEGLQAVPLSDAEDLVARVDACAPLVVVADLCLPTLHDGMEVLMHCRAIAPHMPVIALLERNDASLAIEAVRKGAFDVLTPETISRLPQMCRRATRALELTLQSRAAASADDEEEAAVATCGTIAPISQVLRGDHTAIRKMRQALLRLSHIDTDVLVKAETGCGKEVVARCLHDYGPRASKPFVAINCGAIPENIFESELFGHETGAFTGANKRRVGKLEYAAGGTVFLDEIESMPLAMQVKLLRALQQRCIERVGGNESIRLRCRVVAATKDDLLELSRQGRFRMDLYYRLNVVELGLPPLRDRREDIPALAEGFAHEAAERHGLIHKPLDVEFVFDLMTREWPGNVRELRNAVERHVLGVQEIWTTPEERPKSLAQQVADYERSVIEQCLQVCRGSVTRVAEVLDVPRKTLYDKLTRFAVDPSTFRHRPEVAARH